MYAMAVALGNEMSDFPGGPKALEASVLPGAQALRLMRWPAEHLDTLGGYLTYHNLTLFAFLLGVYGAVLGTRAVRGAEDRHSLEEILATGWSRRAVIRDRALGFFITLALISVGLGLGTAASMAAGGEPNLGGSLATVAASGLCAMVAYSLGLLISQLTRTARAAAGLSAILLTVLYVGTNVWDELGPLGALRFLSPFYYANFSRALVPGYDFDIPSAGALVAMSAALLGLATWAFERRDYDSSLWVRQRRPARLAARPARVERPMLGSIWTATLLRERFGLLAWSGAAAAFLGLMMLLQPAVMDAWTMFGSYFAGTGGAGISPEAQYASFAAEIVMPIIAAFAITQAAGWVTDLSQGRVEVILSAPVSWSRLVWERLLALTVGVAIVTAGALGGMVIGAAAVGAELSAGGLGRLAVDCVLLGAALGSVAAVVVAGLRRGGAVTALAVFVAASYLLGYLVLLFHWPDWVNRFSIFSAFGHPYTEWPPTGEVAVLLLTAILGGLLAAAIAERTPKAV